jgi:hypothetical protein
MSKSKCFRGRLGALLFVALIVVPFAPQIGCAAELSEAQRAYLKKLDGPILLRGDYFKAIAAAYEDFSKRLERDAVKSRALTGEEANHSQWLSRIENYDINVEEAGTMILVSFSPTVRGDPPIIFGGVVNYQVDRKTFQIVSKTAIK